MASIAPGVLRDRIARELTRAQIRARNGLRHIGGTATGPIGARPKSPVWRRDGVVLYRYHSSAHTQATPIMLVMSLLTKPYVFDLRPGSSLVADLLAAGFDVYLLDWGVPGSADSYNGLETYCDQYLPRATQAVARVSGSDDLTIFGYCLGALLSLVSAAGNPRMPARNLVLLATPVNMRLLGPMANLLADGRLDPRDMLDETGNVPPAVIVESFRFSQPTMPLTTYASLWQSLADDEALSAHNALIGWSNDHIPFPGRAFVQIVELLIRGGKLVDGDVPLGDRVVRLSDLRVPVLNVVGVRDNLVPLEATAPLPRLLPNAEVTTLELSAGHAGLFVGRAARTKCVPSIVTWLQAQS